MSFTHILRTATPSASTTNTLATTSPQPQPSPTPTLASLPLQTPDSKWRIHSAGCKPTCSFPPLEPSTPPLICAAAIQIPGSQWRLALKTKASLKSPNTPPYSPASSASSTSFQPPPTPRLGKALSIPQSSHSHTPSSSSTNSQHINSDTQTGSPERKRTYLDALKYENALRMQLTIKPHCAKLERKIGYLRRWKERWAKFDGLRRVLGCVPSEEENSNEKIEGEGPSAGAPGEGGMPIQNVKMMISRSYGDWRTILWPNLRDFSLAPDENHKTLTGRRVDDEERRRSGREWLDELEREWWGDGPPMLVDGGDRGEGQECWLDEVD